jgi:hypothetical protein
VTIRVGSQMYGPSRSRRAGETGFDSNSPALCLVADPRLADFQKKVEKPRRMG